MRNSDYIIFEVDGQDEHKVQSIVLDGVRASKSLVKSIKDQNDSSFPDEDAQIIANTQIIKTIMIGFSGLSGFQQLERIFLNKFEANFEQLYQVKNQYLKKVILFTDHNKREGLFQNRDLFHGDIDSSDDDQNGFSKITKKNTKMNKQKSSEKEKEQNKEEEKQAQQKQGSCEGTNNYKNTKKVRWADLDQSPEKDNDCRTKKTNGNCKAGMKDSLLMRNKNLATDKFKADERENWSVVAH